jgi:uncharacterized damage-inducible protein DinB
MDMLDRLLGHDRWTTSRLLVLSQDLTDAQLDQQFDIGVGTLRDTFEHMIFNVEAWTASMLGQPIDRSPRDRSLAALRDRHDRGYAAFADFARQMRDERRLDDTFVDHADWRNSFGGVIAHVILHNAQHRGEALHMLQRLGAPDLTEGDPLEWEYETRAGNVP